MAITLGDQFFSAAERFHQARDTYAKERAALQELEQELLRYTDSYQALPDQAEYIGDGTWRAFENTITGRKYADGDNCWQYVVNPTGTAYSFQDVSEAVAFLGGYKIADDWHEDMNEKMEAAQQQSDEAEARAKAIAEEQGSDAIQLTVAT